MGNYKDDAKIEFFGIVGLLLTILIIILIDKC